MSTTIKEINFVIHGEPASKANSRKLVTNKRTGKTMFIKSSKARKYEEDFGMQCPSLSEPFEGDVEVEIKIYYASRRPDLDESVILDCMQHVYAGKGNERTCVQERVYANDRQVKRKVVEWGLDRDNPRAEVTVRELRG